MNAKQANVILTLILLTQYVVDFEPVERYE